jgi:hypothetical protein
MWSIFFKEFYTFFNSMNQLNSKKIKIKFDLCNLH